MANSDVIGNLSAARWDRVYRQMNVWPMVVFNRSAELMWGDTLEIPVDATTDPLSTVTLANAQGTAIADHKFGDPTVASANKINLTANQVKRINEIVPSVVQAQSRPSYISERMRIDGLLAAEQVSDYVRSQFQAQNNAAQLLTAISVSSANLKAPNAGLLTAVRGAFYEAKEELDYAHMPPMRVAVVSPAVHSIIERYFEDAKIPYQSMLNDQLTMMGSIMSLSGFRIISDAAPGAGKESTDDAKHTMFFSGMGEDSGISYVEKFFRPIRATEDNEYDGMHVTGSFGYGAVVNLPAKVRLAKFAIS